MDESTFPARSILLLYVGIKSLKIAMAQKARELIKTIEFIQFDKNAI